VGVVVLAELVKPIVLVLAAVGILLAPVGPSVISLLLLLLPLLLLVLVLLVSVAIAGDIVVVIVVVTVFVAAAFVNEETVAVVIEVVIGAL
jgi:hypothetical protein